MRFATTVAGALALYAGFAGPARADLANGESIVRNICASCHGFPPLGGPERAAGNPTLIRQAINSRVPSMFFLRGVLTDADINDVAAYLLTLQTPTPTPSYQGLWINGNESGWGINFTQQGTNLFATWFTYDTDGSGMWLVMSDGTQAAPGRFQGTLLRTTGPGFNSQPFTAIGPSNYTPAGTFSVTFTDTSSGSMTYTVNGVTQTKSITRFLFAQAGSSCTVGGSFGSTPNYTDLWWHDATESGWGVNLVHQGNILFATWFTYEAGGTAASPAKGMWLVMSQGNQVSPGAFSGDLQRTTGVNAFSNSTPFNPNAVQRTTVGTATFTFTGPNSGTFAYTVNGISQSKTIQRLAFASPQTVCQ